MKRRDSIIIVRFLISLLLVMGQACATLNTNKMNEETVSITGVALNGKGGALVKTTDGHVYYIDRLSAWPADVHNQEVEVTGKLKVETVNEDELKNANGEWNQAISGEIKMIQKALWKIL